MAFEDYEIRTRPMTSDEVLATLIDQQRDDFGETLLASVTPASPVKALFDTYPILPWGDIANSLNAMFELSVSLDEWRPVLLPKRRRTVGALCDFIARRATILDIQPVTVMGDTSLAAGVFLAMRHIFGRLGADVSDLRPSSPVAPYFRAKLDALPLLMRSAPGRVPFPSIDTTVHASFAWGAWVSWIIAMLGGWVGVPPGARVLSGVSLALFAIAGLVSNRTVQPHDVRFGAARTFGDLARVIAGERCAIPGFPVIVR